MSVYLTTNKVNGKRYIGCSRKNIKSYFGSGKLITSAIKKYGKSNFSRIILETCNDEKSLMVSEKYWIKKYDATISPDFYNLHKGGIVPKESYTNHRKTKCVCAGMNKGIPRTDDEKERISNSLKLYFSKHVSVNLGKKYSDSTKKLMSVNRKGKLTGKDNHKSRKIKVYFSDDSYTKFNSVKESSEVLNINKNTMGTLATTGNFSNKYKIKVEKLNA